MKKSQTYILFACFCFLLLTSCNGNDNLNEAVTITNPEVPVAPPSTASVLNTETPIANTPTIAPTPPIFDENDYKILTIRNFDETKDLQIFNNLGDFPVETILYNGFATFSLDTISVANTDSFLNYGNAVHFRWKVNEQRTCFAFFFPLFFENPALSDTFYTYRVDSCSQQTLSVQTEYPHTANIRTETISEGLLLTTTGKWIDTVIWFDDDDTSSFNIFSWESENPEIFFYEKAAVISGEKPVMFAQSIGIFNGSIQLDYLKTIKQSTALGIEPYLWFNAPAYSTNYNELATLIHTNLSSPESHTALANTTVDANAMSAPDYDENRYSIPLDINFANPDDLLYFGDNQIGNSILPDQSVELFGGVALKPELGFGTAVHVRWKLNMDETCFALRFFPHASSEVATLRKLFPNMGGCNYAPLEMVLMTDRTVIQKIPQTSQGMIITEQDKWIDTVMWFTKEDVPTLYVFSWETNTPDIFYMSKSQLTGLENADNFTFVFDIFGETGSIAMKSFKLVSRDIFSYLWANAPAFNQYHEAAMTVFNADLTSQGSSSYLVSSYQNEQPINRPADTFQDDSFIIPLTINFESKLAEHFLQVSEDESSDFENHGSENKGLDIENNIAKFGAEQKTGAILNVPFRFNTAFHLHWKFTEENACSLFKLLPRDASDYELLHLYKFQLHACQSETLEVEFIKNNPIMVNSPAESNGTFAFENGQWMDLVFWIEYGSTPTLKVMTWETDHPEKYYTYSKSLNGLNEADHFTFSLESLTGSMEVNTLELISGDLQSYLWFTAPAYQSHYEEINAVLYADLNSKIAALNEEKEQNIAALKMDAPAFTEQLTDIYSQMVNYDDLPLGYRMYPIEQSVMDSGTGMQFSKTYLQGPTDFASAAGLWLTNVLTISEQPIENQQALLDFVNFNANANELHTDISAVGDFSAAFYTNPFERFVFAKDNVVVDLYCNSLFNNVHPYCKPETLAQLARTIADRLPDTLVKPEQIAVAIPELTSNNIFASLTMKHDNNNKLAWGANARFSSMSLVVYDVENSRIAYYADIVDVSKFRIGEGESPIITGNPGGYNDGPTGENTVFVIANQKNAGEFHLFLED